MINGHIFAEGTLDKVEMTKDDLFKYNFKDFKLTKGPDVESVKKENALLLLKSSMLWCNNEWVMFMIVSPNELKELMDKKFVIKNKFIKGCLKNDRN